MTASGRQQGAAIVGARRTPAQARGADGEERAARLLQAKGLHIVARNVRCRGGEIDLIALEGPTLVFVEVRVRSNPRFGGAAASISPAKQRRILLAAQWWLGGAGRGHAARPMRIDAILIHAAGDDGMQWVRNAITADGW